MAGTQKNIEKPKVRPGVKESVEDILKRKEQAGERPDVARTVTEGIQGEVADVMAGMEAPKEKASEKAGERGSERRPSGQIIGDDSQQTAFLEDLKSQKLPEPEVMIQRIRARIRADIQSELKKANKLLGSLNKGSAHEYSTMIARVRRLKHILRQLLTATYDFIKDLYIRLFSPGRKPI